MQCTGAWQLISDIFDTGSYGTVAGTRNSRLCAEITIHQDQNTDFSDRFSNRNGFIPGTIFAIMLLFLLCALSDPNSKEREKQTGKGWIGRDYFCKKIFSSRIY